MKTLNLDSVGSYLLKRARSELRQRLLRRLEARLTALGLDLDSVYHGERERLEDGNAGPSEAEKFVVPRYEDQSSGNINVATLEAMFDEVEPPEVAKARLEREMPGEGNRQRRGQVLRRLVENWDKILYLYRLLRKSV